MRSVSEVAMRNSVESRLLPCGALSSPLALGFAVVSRARDQTRDPLKVPATIGHRVDAEVEILSDLSFNPAVAVHPGDRVRDGARAEPRYQPLHVMGP
jgi:hypothetical protein